MLSATQAFSGQSPEKASAASVQSTPATGGQVRVVLSYVEFTGGANLRMTWDGPNPGNGVWVSSAVLLTLCQQHH